MPVEVTEVKEIKIRWALSEAIIKAGTLSMAGLDTKTTIAEQVVKDPKGFVEYAQRIADALIQFKPKEPRRPRKDKGIKKWKTAPLANWPEETPIVNDVKERMNLTAFTPDELAVLTTPEQNQEKVVPKEVKYE